MFIHPPAIKASLVVQALIKANDTEMKKILPCPQKSHSPVSYGLETKAKREKKMPSGTVRSS